VGHGLHRCAVRPTEGDCLAPRSRSGSSFRRLHRTAKLSNRLVFCRRFVLLHFELGALAAEIFFMKSRARTDYFGACGPSPLACARGRPAGDQFGLAAKLSNRLVYVGGSNYRRQTIRPDDCFSVYKNFGAPGRIRTADHLVRSRVIGIIRYLRRQLIKDCLPR
jgi:hypothetical protein